MAPLQPRPNNDISASLSHLTLRAPKSALSSFIKRHPVDLASLASHHNLLSRQQSSALIPANYTNSNSGPSPGTVVGIVLGSVGAFLILLWLLYTCFGGGSIFQTVSESRVVMRERKRSYRSHSTRSRRASEVREVRASVPVERVIVTEERRERRASRVVPPESSISSITDEVVVIEEHDPPRRSKSKRESRESGYRTVDPLAYGGGDRPLRKVSTGSRR